MAGRFFCPEPLAEGRFTLGSDEARHLVRVLRFGVGDRVEVFDGRGFATLAVVTELGRDRVELAAEGEPLVDRVAPCQLTLATAVPKGERFDWLVEKATELGVHRLVPLITERSVVDPRTGKLDRLRRAIVEACKQCGRNRLMELETPTSWERLVTEAHESVRIVAQPCGLPPELWPRVPHGGSAVLAIGPEGGFTESEVTLARNAGWTVARLGATVLRIETAGLAGSAALLALCGERVE